MLELTYTQLFLHKYVTINRQEVRLVMFLSNNTLCIIINENTY